MKQRLNEWVKALAHFLLPEIYKLQVGTLVLVSHDVADIFLEGGKLVRYSGVHKTLTNVCFVFFMSRLASNSFSYKFNDKFSWILTRLTYYPFVVIRSALFEAADLIQPDYRIFNPFQVYHFSLNKRFNNFRYLMYLGWLLFFWSPF